MPGSETSCNESCTLDALTELGFKQRGRVIVERLTRAFEQAQRTADKDQTR
ncbi:hypothetical protein BJ965_006995 [Streptomyces luteogriseus]|uniref:Uncharacterized protein n=1 Tax=Streptomyces luteogriseus TaxID=68233 RepID=A0A7W7DUB3_9ACTN|nr:hypothetical protein [Streptomyces luteogriseus]MBB4717113.1 hypothetical protein [Streptomyces luteogriseus]